MHTSSWFSLDFVVLNLVPRPPFDEEIRVRDFVMLACSLSAIFSVMYTCCCVQLSFLRESRKCEPALVWLARFSVRECLIFFLHTKDSVDKRESLLVWLFSINWPVVNNCYSGYSFFFQCITITMWNNCSCLNYSVSVFLHSRCANGKYNRNRLGVPKRTYLKSRISPTHPPPPHLSSPSFPFLMVRP